MEKTHEFARLRLQCKSERMKRRYDTDATTETFSYGEAIWLYNPKRRKGISPKLSCDWEGPYLVIKPINELPYSIQKSAKSKQFMVHRNRLCKYYESQKQKMNRRIMTRHRAEKRIELFGTNSCMGRDSVPRV